jgi:hypothetical protein
MKWVFWEFGQAFTSSKNMNEFLNFFKKMDQCSTFKGEKKKIEFRVVEKKSCCLDCFFIPLGSLGSSQKTSKIKF